MLVWSKKVIFPVLLALALGTLGAVPAHASSTDLRCTVGSAYILMDTPLQAGESSFFIGYADVSGCTSPDGSSTLTQGPIGLSGKATAAPGTNPCSLILNMQVNGSIEWTSGEVSNVSGTLSTNPAAPPLGISATVTAGPLDGDTAHVIPVLLPNLNCPFVGLESLTVPAFIISFTS
jgi:hypothetical protein